MKVRFWGVRGSIATSGPNFVRYGGNTSCVEVETAGRQPPTWDDAVCATGLFFSCGVVAASTDSHRPTTRTLRPKYGYSGRLALCPLLFPSRTCCSSA